MEKVVAHRLPVDRAGGVGSLGPSGFGTVPSSLAASAIAARVVGTGLRHWHLFLEIEQSEWEHAHSLMPASGRSSKGNLVDHEERWLLDAPVKPGHDDE
ncbi:hypothetical protein AUC68_08205 [Methyloceanibacter methanicus]|uniref:Uncharacterized protein n=1 Tax=Methyloceanibacter methanicus TaxID=1774968 RepID=A0A1E3VXX9_9HYPH|nr:hypothetical protein AUC68_08205 [Methyloceanibacter methanicus]